MMNTIKNCASFPISLFVTGEGIEQAVQEYCNTIGLCVTITETLYVFKGGKEKGYIIGLINYPRFPVKEYDLFARAKDLGEYLIAKCNPNGSFTLQMQWDTYFYSNRPGD